LLLFGQLEKAGYVPRWDDERVALCDGESVVDRHGELALQADTMLIQATEWAVVYGHEMSRFFLATVTNFVESGFVQVPSRYDTQDVYHHPGADVCYGGSAAHQSIRGLG
jgi:hypothetical protein